MVVGGRSDEVWRTAAHGPGRWTRRMDEAERQRRRSADGTQKAAMHEGSGLTRTKDIALKTTAGPASGLRRERHRAGVRKRPAAYREARRPGPRRSRPPPARASSSSDGQHLNVRWQQRPQRTARTREGSVEHQQARPAVPSTSPEPGRAARPCVRAARHRDVIAAVRWPTRAGCGEDGAAGRRRPVQRAGLRPARYLRTVRPPACQDAESLTRARSAAWTARPCRLPAGGLRPVRPQGLVRTYVRSLRRSPRLRPTCGSSRRMFAAATAPHTGAMTRTAAPRLRQRSRRCRVRSRRARPSPASSRTGAPSSP